MNGVTAGGLPTGTITASVSAPRQRATAAFGPVGGGLAYVAGGSSQELAGFYPMLRSADSEVLPARDRIVARSRDIDRNDGLIAGGIDRRVDAVIGSRIWLQPQPDFAAMEMSAEWADAWSRRTASLFRLWANSSRFLCDVERHHHFGAMVQLAYRHFVTDGSACAPIYFLDRGGLFSTAVLVLDPDRLVNPRGKADDPRCRGGVQLDQWGAEIGYWVRPMHPSDVGITFTDIEPTFIPRESPSGRPLFVRAINKRRAHQHHAVGRLASVMARIKMRGLADQTELQAQITNAIFGLYASTKRDSEQMGQSMAPAGDGIADTDEVRAGFYEQADLTFGGVRVAVLPDGDEIKTLTTERGSTNFVAFQNYILGSIASAIGMSKEQLSNEWTGINYSSARTLLNEIWRGWLGERHAFTQMFCTPIYAAWLEEAVARDLVEVPGGKANFYLFRDALTQCEWIGPGRGSIDPKKEADALEVEMRLGLTSQSDELLARGKDPEAVRWQRKRDAEQEKAYGLTPAPATGNAGGGNDTNSGGDTPDGQDARDEREAAGAEA